MNFVSLMKLVEIQTKVASMLPFVLGTAYAGYRFKAFSPGNFVLMLVSLLAFDMATTAVNNYMDFKRALNKRGYNYEIHNAIVRDNLREKTVAAVIGILLATASLAGILLFLRTGYVVLFIGMVSFAVGILYSYGPVPISRTPFGELFSGFFMGFVIVYLSVYIQVPQTDLAQMAMEGDSLRLSLNLRETLLIFLVAFPMVAGIANIMLANNICDMEDDRANGRHTLPLYIGKEKSLRLFGRLYQIACFSVVLAVFLGVGSWFNLATVATYPLLRRNVAKFRDRQIKGETFVYSVKNFMVLGGVHTMGYLLTGLLK